MTTYSGYLFHYDEQGMEGGHWFFRDEHNLPTKTGDRVCGRCNLIWPRDLVNPPRLEQVPPVVRLDPELWGPTPEPAVPMAELIEQNRAYYRACLESKHAWVELIDNFWSGVHWWADNDYLMIFDPTDSQKVIWEGSVLADFEPTFLSRNSNYPAKLSTQDRK